MNKDNKATLMKRARAKYMSKKMAIILAENNPKSPLVKAYRNSFYCNDNLIVNDETGFLTGTYCKNRWCHICNRNKTAKLINGYANELRKLTPLYFVTLTAVTVEERQLQKRIKEMGETWRSIKKNAVKQKIDFSGIKKLECTTRPGRMYHPHYHILVDGEENGRWIIDQWVKRWNKKVTKNKPLAHANAQDMRKADDKSFIEIFKYCTKLIVKIGDRDLSGDLFQKGAEKKRGIMHPHDLDVIFRAMKGRRIFQSFGKIRQVNEEVEEKEKITIGDDFKGKLWKWVEVDWISELGEFLTNYRPSKGLKYAFEKIGL